MAAYLETRAPELTLLAQLTNLTTRYALQQEHRNIHIARGRVSSGAGLLCYEIGFSVVSNALMSS